MRALAKSVLASLARKLPWGGRQAVLEALIPLCEPGDLFVRLGNQMRVESVTIHAANGRIAGPLWDMDSSGYGLLGRYGTQGEWASSLVRQFEDFFTRAGQGTFIDIGANIGLTTIPIARNPRIRCFAFEPVPSNFDFLTQNVAANCTHGNVILQRMAILNQSGFIDMALSETNSGDHQVCGNGTTRRQITKVQAEPLDDIIEPLDVLQPIAVKIDTQGAESQVFSGGQKVLSHAQLVSFEFTPQGIRRMNGNLALLDFVREQFREGAITKGDSEEAVFWRPIGETVAELRTYWDDPSIGNRYFDVLVRK